MPEPRTIWKNVTAAGFFTILGSLTALLIFEDFFQTIMMAIGIGLLIMVIGLIGWAIQLGRRARARLASLAFALPAIVVTIGLATNPNAHGIFPLFFLASIPLLIVGIILSVMALVARRNS